MKLVPNFKNPNNNKKAHLFKLIISVKTLHVEIIFAQKLCFI